MTKFYSTLVLFFIALQFSNAQLNMSLLSTVNYDANLSDIWGWVDESTGTEYAIVGVNDGVSIVSLEDPTNATELFFIDGQNSTWRDIKTWGDYAYVTTDQGGTTDGLLIIDLSMLPNDIAYQNWNPEFPGVDGGVMNTCHNIYIDEFGYAYLSGCNINNGGIIYLDVATTPGSPIFAGAGLPIYSHDVYARDNRTYSSEIYGGELAIYDVTDKNNTQLIGSTSTPFEFTHNAWLSDDGNYVFTTDELANAPVAAYDISDPTDIEFLDEYRPIETINENVIPHNVHVWDDYLIISYYTDGGRIVDATYPDNLIEVGNFDTFLGGSGGFSGAWGAYPFLPSGNVLLTDIGNGLYVCGADYKRACYLEGVVSDITTGSPIQNAEIQILTDELNDGESKANGSYKTGIVTAGTYSVEFSHPNYITKVIDNVSFDNGVLTELNAELEPKQAIIGNVFDINTQNIANSAIQLTNNNTGASYEYQSNADGVFSIFAEEGNYTALVGAWGYKTIEVEVDLVSGQNVEFELEEGYEDNFALDLGWEIFTTASSGDWERAVPQESNFQGSVTTLGFDLANDLGESCLVTGNGGQGGANDIDDGSTTASTPAMDLSNYSNAVVNFSAFFWNGGGQGAAANDALKVSVSNGVQFEEILSITEPMTNWESFSIELSDYITLNENVSILFEASDDNPGHISEAMLDGFSIEGTLQTDVDELETLNMDFKVGPNPCSNYITYSINNQILENTFIVIYSNNGMEIIREEASNEGTVNLNDKMAAGSYIISLENNKGSIIRKEFIKL